MFRSDNDSPILLNWLPPVLRSSVVSRFYMRQAHRYPTLFKRRSLQFCPVVSMYDLVPGDQISGHIAFTGFYELALTHRICALARNPGGLMVDVGGNMGYFSLLWAGLSSENRCIVLEALPRNVDMLSSNIQKNELQDRVVLLAKAAGTQPGFARFNPGPVHQTGWGGFSSTDLPDDIDVEVVCLDDIIGNRLVEVLKIDVEGADTWVLQGCRELLGRGLIRHIFFEQNAARMQALGIELGAAQALLESLGYLCSPYGNSGDQWYARRKHVRGAP